MILKHSCNVRQKGTGIAKNFDWEGCKITYPDWTNRKQLCNVYIV